MAGVGLGSVGCEGTGRRLHEMRMAGVWVRQGIQPPEGLDQEQRAAWLHDTAFLSQLLDNSKARACCRLCLAHAVRPCRLQTLLTLPPLCLAQVKPSIWCLWPPC